MWTFGLPTKSSQAARNALPRRAPIRRSEPATIAIAYHAHGTCTPLNWGNETPECDRKLQWRSTEYINEGCLTDVMHDALHYIGMATNAALNCTTPCRSIARDLHVAIPRTPFKIGMTQQTLRSQCLPSAADDMKT